MRPHPCAATTSTRLMLAGGDGAGLVEHDRVDPAGGLEDLRTLDEDAELGAATGADQQRGGRGQPERARAGDDQDRDRGGERERWPVACDEPADERCRDRPTTTGTNTADTRSARRWTGALPAWASSTSRAICASRGVRPDPGRADDEAAAALTVAPTTSSPGPTSTGTDSPVSMRCRPRTRRRRRRRRPRPSRPGRTTKESPTASSPMGTRVSTPSRKDGDVLGAQVSRARRAAPERVLARASR